MLFGDDGTLWFVKKSNRDYKNKKLSPFLKKFLHQAQSTTLELEPKKQKLNVLWPNCVNYPLVDTTNQKLYSVLIFYTFNLEKINLIFSVSDDGIEWSLEFEPDSVTLILTNLFQEVTICYPEFPLPAWSLLLSQKQDFLNRHPVRVPLPPPQETTMEMKDEVLSSMGAQVMDTSGYQVSDLDNFEIYWENDQLEVEAVFRPGIDTSFSLPTFNNCEMRSMTENPILIDEKQNKENSCPAPTTPVHEKSTHTPVLMRSCPFRTRTEKVPDYVYKKFLQ